MGDVHRHDEPMPVEPDEPRKRAARRAGQNRTEGETSDADAAAPGRDDHHRPVGSAGGGQYGADSRGEQPHGYGA
jgi:hypothetical protein